MLLTNIYSYWFVHIYTQIQRSRLNEDKGEIKIFYIENDKSLVRISSKTFQKKANLCVRLLFVKDISFI